MTLKTKNNADSITLESEGAICPNQLYEYSKMRNVSRLSRRYFHSTTLKVFYPSD